MKVAHLANLATELLVIGTLCHGRNLGHRVPGGQEAKRDSPGFDHYISVARLGASPMVADEILCGATIVASVAALTSASCFEKFEKTEQVKLAWGVFKTRVWREEKFSFNRKISQIFPHENYLRGSDQSSKDYDITVLKTMYVLRADREGHASTAAAARIHSANVQAMENVVLPGKMIIVLGMGGKEVDGSQVLRSSVLRMRPKPHSHRAYKHMIFLTNWNESYSSNFTEGDWGTGCFIEYGEELALVAILTHGGRDEEGPWYAGIVPGEFREWIQRFAGRPLFTIRSSRATTASTTCTLPFLNLLLAIKVTSSYKGLHES